MTKEEIIENSRPQVKELDSNNAIIYDQFVMLTHETYNEIKEKLEILDIYREFFTPEIYYLSDKTYIKYKFCGTDFEDEFKITSKNKEEKEYAKKLIKLQKWLKNDKKHDNEYVYYVDNISLYDHLKTQMKKLEEVSEEEK